MAFVIFASLTETIVSVMTQHFATLGGLFQNGLSDASLKAGAFTRSLQSST